MMPAMCVRVPVRIPASAEAADVKSTHLTTRDWRSGCELSMPESMTDDRDAASDQAAVRRAVARPELIGAGRLRRDRQRAENLVVFLNRRHLRVAGELIDLAGRAREQRAPPSNRSRLPQSVGPRQPIDLGLRAIDDDLEGLARPALMRSDSVPSIRARCWARRARLARSTDKRPIKQVTERGELGGSDDEAGHSTLRGRRRTGEFQIRSDYTHVPVPIRGSN